MDIQRPGLEIAVKRGADGVQSGREGGPGFRGALRLIWKRMMGGTVEGFCCRGE